MLRVCVPKVIALFLVVVMIVRLDCSQGVVESRGVWMGREVLINGPESIEKAFYKLARAGFNRVYVNVYYKGAAIYPSEVVEAAGGPKQRPEFSGWDPLETSISIGHRWGLEVVAWFEYGLMVHWNEADTSDPGPILSSNPDWIALSKDGRKYIKNRWGVFFWLDPAHPDVVNFMKELFSEVARKYPDLDGIETDRIRYPSLEFSYSQISRSRYMSETGGSDPINIDINDVEWMEWVKWRESQTTNVAREIYRAVKSENPKIVVSAAVTPPYMQINHEKLQAWDTWADSNYVDILEPMLYVSDSDFKNQLETTVSSVPLGFYIYPGISYSSFSSLNYQVSETRKSGLNGLVLWYYSYIPASVFDELRNGLFKQKADLPHNTIIVDDSSWGFEYRGSWEKKLGGYKGDYIVSSGNGGGDYAVWRMRVFKTGKYEIFARWVESAENSAGVRYELRIGDRVKYITVNQQEKGEPWIFLTSDSIKHCDSVVVKLYSNSTGKVVADAVKVSFSPGLKLIDINVPDSTEIELRFNRGVEEESGEDVSNYKIRDGVDILNADVDELNNTVVELKTTSLHPGREYSLEIKGINDNFGNSLSEEWTISYNPLYTDICLDNSDEGFKTYGTWYTGSDGSGYIGNDYVFSEPGSGENRAMWWKEIRVEGYYDIFVKIPEVPKVLADGAIYTVMHNFGTDTVFINQERAKGTWVNVGRYYYNSGKVAGIMVSNKIAEGLVVADAVKIERVLTPLSLGKSPKEKSNIPSLIELYGNYPNPFNPLTTIEFELRKEGFVSLKIFNVLGQEIESKINRKLLLPGKYSVVFDGKGFPSGLYFYKIFYYPVRGKTGLVSDSGKMLLIR